MRRRTLLKGMLGGAAVSVALPPLEAMFNDNATAHADGTPLPKRFGVFFWAGGLPWHGKHRAEHGGRADLWTPGDQGPGWTPSPLLTPLAAHRDRINVISGLEPHTEVPRDPDGQGDGHMRGAAVALTADRCRSEGFHHPSHVFAFNRETIDQHIARHPDFYTDGGTRFRSLELGVSRVRFHDYGHWNSISHSGPDSLNIPIQSPVTLFNHLFNVPPDLEVLGRRATLLDAVSEDARALQRRLGVRDRARIEEHLDHLGQIQRRLQRTGGICQAPAAPGETEDVMTKMSVMTELLAVALKCDLTRVFSMMLTSPATNHVFGNVGVAGAMHQVCHDGNWEEVRRITEFQMQCFARFLDIMASTTEVTGESLLDQMCIYATSEYGEGTTHSNHEYSVMFVGRAGGAMNTGIHYRDEGGNLGRVHLTVLQAMGIGVSSYGFNGGETSDPLPVLA